MSHNDFDSNCFAFYNYLVENGYNKKYKIVWQLRNKLDRKLPKNVTSVLYNERSFKRKWYFNTAKFILSDGNALEKLKDDQINIYTTHGIGFKDVRGYLDVNSTVDYILSPSVNYDPIQRKSFNADRFPDVKMIHAGMPFNDTLFRESDEISKITDKKFNKTILWTPTFRMLGKRNDSNIELPLGIPVIDTLEQLEDVNDYLKELNILLILKLHPFQNLNCCKDLKSLSNIIVINGGDAKLLGLDVYRMMAASDALISDYSSSSLSYILLDRPMAYSISDIRDYKIGFIIDNYYDFMPGEKLYSTDDLKNFIKNVYEGKDTHKKQREELCDWIYEHKDGQSCKRLADFLGLVKPK